MTENRPSETGLKEYVRAVERRFSRRRGRPGILSPRDFVLVLEWFDRGLPLGVVFRALDEAFERAGEDGIGSLGYLRRPVEREARLWREARLGAGDRTRDDRTRILQDAVSLLARSEEGLRRAAARHTNVQDDLLGLALAVRELREGLVGDLPEASPDLERVEERLRELDRQARSLAERVLGEEEVARLRSGVDARLEPHRHLMSARVHARTVERHVHRALREALGLPELSLFAL